jgi:hypothetical protein
MRDYTVLTRRELTSAPTTLSVEQFVEMIMEDIENAKKTYFEMTSKRAEERYEADKKQYAEQRAQEIEKIIEKSYVKYQREYYRLRWVEKEIARWPEEYTRKYWHNPDTLTYVDWSMKPWENGTSCISFSRGEDIVRDFFKNRFTDDFNNKYFSQCLGWEIVITQRPYFKLILSPELEAEWEADEKRLSDAISRFYATSSYCGD